MARVGGKRVALIVATDHYRDPGLRQLRAPGTDADALAKALGDPDLGEFEVEVLHNETSSTISERVETVLSSGRPDDLIVMHFSCHGLKDDSGELYLAATNTRPALLASTAVDAALVNRLMRRSRAQRVVLFLDCCYGGAFERGMVPRAAGTLDVADQFQQRDAELSGGRGRVVITASNAMEFAFEGTDLADSIVQQPSIFTGALVEGLTTGEADRDQDGMVSLGELYDYVFERVRQESPNQTPGKWEFGLQGDLILARNPQRVVVPAPVPVELLELIEHPFPATRLGSVDALTRLAEGTNLPIAAGARAALERMVNDDSRSVAAAATAAVAKTSLRLSAADMDFGTVEVGARAAADISIEGVPLASASRVESSSPAIKVRRIERTIRIELETSVSGPIEGIVTVDGPAGTAQVRVVGLVAAEAVEQHVPPGTQVEVPVTDEPAAAEPEPAPSPEPVADLTAAADATSSPESVVVPAQPGMATQAPAEREAPGRATAAAPGPTPERRPAEPEPTAAIPGGVAAASMAEDLMAAAASAQAPSDRRAIAIRAASRGLLGALIGGVIGDVWYFNSSWDWGFETWDWRFSLVLLLVDIVAMATTVVIAEIVVPAIRVPDGKAYGPLRHHHLPTAAAQGAVVGVIVGAIGAALLFGAYFQTEERTLIFTPYLRLIVTPVSIAIGFALAQAALQRTRIGT